MSRVFIKNEIIETKSGDSIRIIDNIGGGQEAEVYRVYFNGKESALKYFHKKLSTPECKQRIVDLIKLFHNSGPFVMPEKLVELEDDDCFGYVMEYVDRKKFLSVGALINKSDIEPYQTTVVKCCLLICQSFSYLNAKGYSYKDISSSNILLDVINGAIKIIDTSNITPSNECGSVNGTPGYIAPELVENPRELNSTYTDNFSLAVILFQLLTNLSPLDSEKHQFALSDYPDSGVDINVKQYGFNAKFLIRDENEIDSEFASEENAENFKFTWNKLPKEIRKLFYRAFTNGIKDPKARPSAHEWTEALIRFYSSFFKSYDEKGNFIELEFNKDAYVLCHNEIRSDIDFKKINLPILDFESEPITFVLYNGRIIEYMYFGSTNLFDPVLEVILNKEGLRFKNLYDCIVQVGSTYVGKGEVTPLITETNNRVSVIFSRYQKDFEVFF